MAADRGAYIDQSQSFNVHMTDINYGKLTSMHFYGWKKVLIVHNETYIYCPNMSMKDFFTQGLKTGMYYLRSKPAAQAIQFTVDQEALQKTSEEKAKLNEEALACSLENKDACVMCSG